MATLTKAQIKHIQAFAEKKYRDIENCFIAEGAKLISDLLRMNQEPLVIYSILDNLLPNAVLIDSSEMKKISQFQTPSNSLAIFKKKQLSILNPTQQIVLALDGIQDPGNLGTIVRTAHWFGIQHIICSLDTADVYNSKTVQATMGSIAQVNVHRIELANYLSTLNNVQIFATTLDGDSLGKYSKIKSGIVVLGKEGEGIRSNVLSECNRKIKIDGKASQFSAESLNVGVACGIICNALV